ncbi:reverse transcriptase [Gossypium australe]|uniref:Reverse transcriptase n=1 Tax=Gossypium australe TaxID=47621 RepID=A0A5B6UW68_9ROSI|nr:reverse transcriptase [Gossypium australe]
MSIGGRKVLIKAVLQIIPITQIFTCSIIVAEKSREKRFALQSLCFSKDEGGMRFCDLSKFNIAILFENSSSLTSRLIRANYYQNSNFLEALFGSNPLLVWRSIWCSKALLSSGLRKRIGSGQLVSIWQDYWLLCKDQAKITTIWVVELILEEEDSI